MVGSAPVGKGSETRDDGGVSKHLVGGMGLVDAATEAEVLKIYEVKIDVRRNMFGSEGERCVPASAAE